MQAPTPTGSVGIVRPADFTFASSPKRLALESGRTIGPITLRYETYGTLNDDASNAVLVCHATSGNHHAAGRWNAEDRKPGWWDNMIGPGKAFDTDHYYVISSNILGGCDGSTGPASQDPETDRPYGVAFPLITIGDMVEAQRHLVEHLGIRRLRSVAGGSMGGMQALEWAVRFPEMVESAIVIAATSTISAQGIAFHAVGRNAIMSDPKWNDGDYYDGEAPAKGLAIARMIGHITYLSDQSLGRRFGRKLQEKATFGYDFSNEFEVESYIEYKGISFVDRFDANSYLYITKAMDYYDLGETYGGMVDAFRRTAANFLVMSFTSDWLYPSGQSREIVSALMRAGKDASYVEIDSPYGHDSFLLETERQTRVIRSFLENAR